MLTIQSVVCGPAAAALWSLLEEQSLRSHARPAESECVLQQDPQVIHKHTKI